MTLSLHDHKLLPREATPDRLSQLQHALRNGSSPSWYLALSPKDRYRVWAHTRISHIVDVPPTATMNYGGAGSTTVGYGVYQRPNGGKRILPSIYTKLEKQWLRSTGRYIYPQDMDSTHIKNCLNLLKESHGNIIARMCLSLGNMHNHLQCDVVIQDQMDWMAKRLELIEVDHMYPIFNVLARELEAREQAEKVKQKPHRARWSSLYGEITDGEGYDVPGNLPF